MPVTTSQRSEPEVRCGRFICIAEIGLLASLASKDEWGVAVVMMDLGDHFRSDRGRVISQNVGRSGRRTSHVRQGGLSVPLVPLSNVRVGRIANSPGWMPFCQKG